MAREFGFDDQTRDEKLGGEVAFAFFLLGVPACVLIGILADNYSRVKLFAFAIFLGQGPNLFISIEDVRAVVSDTGVDRRRRRRGTTVGVFYDGRFVSDIEDRTRLLGWRCMSLKAGLGQGIAGYAERVRVADARRRSGARGDCRFLVFSDRERAEERLMDGNSYSSEDLVGTGASAAGVGGNSTSSSQNNKADGAWNKSKAGRNLLGFP